LIQDPLNYPKNRTKLKKPKITYLQLGLGVKESVRRLQLHNGLGDNLIDDGLCRLLLIHNGSNLAHQPRTNIVHRLIVKLVGLLELLDIVLGGDDALGGQRLDLLAAVLLPVGDVWVVADTEWATLLSRNISFMFSWSDRLVVR